MNKFKLALVLGAVSVAMACSGATEEGNNIIDANGTTGGNATTNVTTGSNNGADAYVGLVINEVAAAGDPDDWAEFYNGSDSAIDMTGVTYTDDIVGQPARAAFPDGTTIEPGAYLVIDFVDPVPGFGLGGDEELGLSAPNGEEIDSVDWDEGDSPDAAAYGRFPNGTGEFKTLFTPTRGAQNVDNMATDCGNEAIETPEVCDGSNLAGDTCASEGFTGGTLTCAADCMSLDTSGCEGAPPAGVLVLNEVKASGDDNIELFNGTDAVIDLEGWYVADDGWDPADAAGTADQRYVFPAGTSIGAGEYLNLVKDIDHGFGVGGDDAIYLFDADDTLVDETSWTDPAADASWCRLPNGTGDFGTCPFETFGAVNRASGAIINEVKSSGDDNIELGNLGAAEIDLEGWYVADTGWDPADVAGTAEQRYVFPAGTSIPADGYLNLVKDTDHTFGVGGEDGIFLYNSDDELIDSTQWPDGDADISWCRLPDLTGEFQVCTAESFGVANTQ